AGEGGAGQGAGERVGHGLASRRGGRVRRAGGKVHGTRLGRRPAMKKRAGGASEGPSAPANRGGCVMSTVEKAAADVLVVGAGPTGLAMGIELTRMGARCRVIDKVPEPSKTS